jgi:hypothetical protein
MGLFIGRVEELAALDTVVSAADAGKVAAAVVVGEPGSGKSRLLAEVAAQSAIASRFRVVGYEPERKVPLASAIDLLRGLAEEKQVGRELRALVFDAARDERSGLQPIRIFEAAHRALQGLGPALLLVDDLQWVDELSVALCHYLVRAAETGRRPLALISAARPSENATAFAASLRQVVPAERLRSLELEPLLPAEAHELAKALVEGIDDAAALELAAKSGGSPFWLEVLARTGGPDVGAGRLVTARLRGASADANSLLALLAVAARPLALADAAVLEDWDSGRAEHAATELVVRGIAVESEGTVRLAHDLVRAAAAAEIPEERRRDIQRRVSEPGSHRSPEATSVACARRSVTCTRPGCRHSISLVGSRARRNEPCSGRMASDYLARTRTTPTPSIRK